MKKAIDAWQNKDPEYYYDENGKPKTSDCFSTQFGIPTRTFHKYVLGPVEKRRKLGRSVGKNPIMSKESQAFVSDVLARSDRANEGKNRKEVIEIIQDLQPSLSRCQA